MDKCRPLALLGCFQSRFEFTLCVAKDTGPVSAGDGNLRKVDMGTHGSLPAGRVMDTIIEHDMD